MKSCRYISGRITKVVLSVLFSLFVVHFAFRIVVVSLAIRELERCGGAVSPGYSPTQGPEFITFNIPGSPRRVADSDAEDIARALSRFNAITG